MLQPARRNRLHIGPGAVEACVVPRRLGCHRIDIACLHPLLQRERCGDGEHASTGADIEDAARPAALQLGGEMQEAAARGAVMPGAEGEGGFDLDADLVDAQRAAVMRAMHHEPPGPDRRQPGEGSPPPNPSPPQHQNAPRRLWQRQCSWR